MKPRAMTIRELKAAGYELKRNGANHDIYFNREIGRIIPLKRHDFNENDMEYILKEIRRNAEQSEPRMEGKK